MKTPIGTATSGVRLVHQAAELAEFARRAAVAGAFRQGGLLAQDPVDGQLAMVQGVLDDGHLVAFHANLRVREGSNGGASHKRSVALPLARDALAEIGRSLEWSGALSADVILTGSEPAFIDMNPRLVEPGNARRAGVDLVGPMLDLARGRHPVEQEPGRPDVATHQLLLSVLGAAQRSGRRRAVLRELSDSFHHRGAYRDSAEELTPVRSDWLAGLPVAVASLATLVSPKFGTAFSRGAVHNYALTGKGWEQLVERRG